MLNNKHWAINEEKNAVYFSSWNCNSFLHLFILLIFASFCFFLVDHSLLMKSKLFFQYIVISQSLKTMLVITYQFFMYMQLISATLINDLIGFHSLAIQRDKGNFIFHELNLIKLCIIATPSILLDHCTCSVTVSVANYLQFYWKMTLAHFSMPLQKNPMPCEKNCS